MPPAEVTVWSGGRKRTTGPSSPPRGERPPPFLTRLATFSGVSRGCRNSAVMSVSDWPEIWAETFEVPDGPGSRSLSSSSSPRLGSGREKETRCSREAAGPPSSPGARGPGLRAASADRSRAVDEDWVVGLALPSKSHMILGTNCFSLGLSSHSGNGNKSAQPS